MDTTDHLITSFNDLTLPASTADPRPQRPRTTFPSLPPELRQKIYTNALPVLTPLFLTAKILISHPRCGLYLTFLLPTQPRSSTPPPPKPLTAQTRSLTLLSLCRESRLFYLSQFSISLPLGPSVYSLLHISPLEMLHIENLERLIDRHGWERAMDGAYPLQSWIGRIERLAIDVGCLLQGTEAWESIESALFRKLGRFLVRCESLREVLVVWEGFEEESGNSIEVILPIVEGLIRDVEEGLENYRENVDIGYVVPTLRIVASVRDAL
ncbi:hypothetical protein N431DRAFT_435885, partial [Stipitochalara longipes BDJ]